MTETSYTAWDDNLYEWPPPDGWYKAADGKWWPSGYGPDAETGGGETLADTVAGAPDVGGDSGSTVSADAGVDARGDSGSTVSADGGVDVGGDSESTPPADAGSHTGPDADETVMFPAVSDETATEQEHQRPVYDELPPIDDVFGGLDPFADDADDSDRPPAGSGLERDQPGPGALAGPSALSGDADDTDPGMDVDLPPLDAGVGQNGNPPAAEPTIAPSTEAPDQAPADTSPLSAGSPGPGSGDPRPGGVFGDGGAAPVPDPFVQPDPERTAADDVDAPVAAPTPLSEVGHGSSPFDATALGEQPAQVPGGAVGTVSGLDGQGPANADPPPFGDPAPLHDDADLGGRRSLDSPEPARTLWPLFVVGICAALLVILLIAFFAFRGDGEDTATSSPAESVPTVGLGSITQPYEFGTAVVVFYDSGGQQRRWVVQVMTPVVESTADVPAGDGEAPLAEGETLAMSQVRVTYQSGPTPGEVDDLRLSSIGASSTLYSAGSGRCSGAPDAFAFDAELEPGQAIEGNLCWQISEADLADLKLAIEAGPADGTVHLALK